MVLAMTPWLPAQDPGVAGTVNHRDQLTPARAGNAEERDRPVLVLCGW